jgi:hypothetical protein
MPRKPMSEETKLKLSNYWKGKKKSSLHIKHIKEAKLGEKNPLYGKTPSKDTLLKRSVALKGKKAWNKGKKCPQLVTNWKGGVSTKNNILRHSMEFRLWRETVFTRDNWICQKSGIRGNTLHPHHILNFSSHPELRFSIDNGITLSEKEHRNFHKIYGSENNTKEQLEEFLGRKL